MAVEKDIDILDVVREHGLVQIKRSGDEIIFRCPFCGDSRKRQNHGHLYINHRKGLFKCHRCGEEGNALQLYAALENIDTRTAYRQLFERKKEEEDVFKTKTYRYTHINRVYRDLMNLLPLYERHVRALKNRGLSENYIFANFRSLPDTAGERHEVIRQLLHRHNLQHVPGFFTRNGRWEMVSGPGILVPVRSLEGEIVGFQVRRDNPGVITAYRTGEVHLAVEYDGEKLETTVLVEENPGEIRIKMVTKKRMKLYHPERVKPGSTFKIKVLDGETDITKDAVFCVKGPAVASSNRTGKYTWFSSAGLPNGSGATAVPTVIIKNVAKKHIWITEGILKAETAATLIEANFVGVPGITSWKKAIEIVKSLEAEEVYVAFDQENNPHTREQERQLLENLLAKNIQAMRVTWPEKEGKGIDDLILRLQKSCGKISEEELLELLNIKKEEAGTAKKVLLRMSQLFANLAERL